MLKYLPVMALAALVSVGCSSSSSDSEPTSGNPGGGGQQTMGRAGTYVGSATDSMVVAVLDGSNDFSGMLLNSAGFATSVFGNVGAGASYSGSFSSYIHDAGNSSLSFGPGRAGGDVGFTTITINDGVSISGEGLTLNYSTGSELVPATATNLEGSWRGDHRFSVGDSFQTLSTSLTISGNSISGSTTVLDVNNAELPDTTFPINGSYTPAGGAAELTFTWQGNTYEGLMFLSPDGSGNLVFVGETDAETNNPTISALLSR